MFIFKIFFYGCSFNPTEFSSVEAVLAQCRKKLFEEQHSFQDALRGLSTSSARNNTLEVL